ncbi:hypothetical protein M419DRAFT_73533 [Trichoderma reesei RUT C-30]|uniref:Uncharacterized protein n=1 Tax=Hypocrea jecorina (strain ATCC 56765 / BCRC 32924 / NRRL 11460 / Rut C-30) TaxID=1344414 RepID=A0A024SIV5_HYPJR|nr:hypothetical protein M419DRAFT_73533 [Trichoderma reesei RUT C-30]
MSDTSPNGSGPGPGPHRRSSITQAALSNLFQRGPSNVPNGSSFNGGNGSADSQRRRLSITTIGLSGTSPTNTSSFMRRGSMSTNSNSDSFEENAIEDEDAFVGPRTAPTTPFARHMSFGGNSAMRNLRTGSSPGNADQFGFNWSEQLRTRAESSVTGARPSFSFQGAGSHSPPRAVPTHDRSKSISDMPQPPAQASSVKPPKQHERPKPDAFQERILKGDFYMD